MLLIRQSAGCRMQKLPVACLLQHPAVNGLSGMFRIFRVPLKINPWFMETRLAGIFRWILITVVASFLPERAYLPLPVIHTSSSSMPSVDLISGLLRGDVDHRGTLQQQRVLQSFLGSAGFSVFSFRKS